MNSFDLIKFTVSLAIPLAVEIVTGMFTARAITGWFVTLKKPSFNPPNWVFAPVWTLLYILMGISLYFIWNLPDNNVRNVALIIFAMQLTFNFGWSFIFFHFHKIGLALLDIIILLLVVIIMIIYFYSLYPLAAYLNIPYLLWVSFATLLNASFYNLNKG